MGVFALWLQMEALEETGGKEVRLEYVPPDWTIFLNGFGGIDYPSTESHNSGQRSPFHVTQFGFLASDFRWGQHCDVTSQGHFAINLWFPYTLLNPHQIIHYEKTFVSYQASKGSKYLLRQTCPNYTCLDIHNLFIFLICKKHYFQLFIVTLNFHYFIQRKCLSWLSWIKVIRDKE